MGIGENHTANDDRRIYRRETKEQPGLYNRNHFFGVCEGANVSNDYDWLLFR